MKSSFMKVLVLLFVASTFFQPYCWAERIGIYGCLHGDMEVAKRVALAMKGQQVTSLIGTGDYGHDIGSVLSLFADATGVSQQNTYLMPGNWDFESINRHKSKEILKHYGHLIAEKYDDSGIIEIAGKKIKVAHFPQQPVPNQFLPPPNFLYSYYNNQGHTLATMAKREPIPRDVYLNIFGHTHIQADFYDKNTGILTINAGPLTDRKLEHEHKSFAILDTEKNQVEFYGVEDENPKLLRTVPVHPPDPKVGEPAEKSHYGEKYDLQDYGICRLDTDDLSKFSEVFFRDTQMILDFAAKQLSPKQRLVTSKTPTTPKNRKKKKELAPNSKVPNDIIRTPN